MKLSTFLARGRSTLFACLAAAPLGALSTGSDVAVRAGELHTVSGGVLRDAVVIVRDGKIAQVGAGASLAIPEGMRVLEAAVVTPGLIDAHSVVGVAGHLNQDHDQDQLEHSAPLQPELRAIDA